ncbi:hypothetical protein RGQ29_004710 [Quercus rubra]|uniref:Uncharacterized protein n=1 Tax=Quercus rubra TaxID=3512 RepID=A0AAN7I9T4_QUERU|nr:hypothetical protein RGQ29_004710 [Quercus rubra]
MAPSFAPSSSTPKLTYEYEVFVSFRGAEIRTTFTSHLFAALDRKTIHAFDDERSLPRGEKIGAELLKAIETSRIAVVVFSKKYATSDWCLDELVKIMECKRVFNQRVLPIFYHVSQPEVLEQKGNFAELPNGPEDKMNSWRAALTEAANLAGLHLEPNRPESDFIEEIVDYILKKLKEESSTAPSLRQNDAPAQHSSATIPHNDASSGSANGSTDLDIVSATRQAMQPKAQEIYQTPQVNGTTLHVNNDFRDMQHFYKNQLQNYAQKRNLRLPVYSCKCEGPPHASQFRCKVTVDGQTYESPELFSTSKDAEHAAAKVALTSLVPDGAKEDNSVLYKNLLQELVQKEGVSLPVYVTNRSGEVHEPIFFSTVVIGEVFKGHEARTKKKAEMNAAKIAYTTLKEWEVFKGHEARTKKKAEMNAAKIAYTTLKEHLKKIKINSNKRDVK